MKAKIDSAKPGRSFTGKEGETVQIYEVVAGGIVYDCFSAKILEMVGKEVDFEVKPPKDEKYHAKLVLPREPGKGGERFGRPGGGGGWSGRSPLEIATSAKTMVLAYGKDVVTALIQAGRIETADEAFAAVEEGYPRLVRLLGLEKIAVQQAAAATGGAPGTSATAPSQPSRTAPAKGSAGTTKGASSAPTAAPEQDEADAPGNDAEWFALQNRLRAMKPRKTPEKDWLKHLTSWATEILDRDVDMLDELSSEEMRKLCEHVKSQLMEGAAA